MFLCDILAVLQDEVSVERRLFSVNHGVGTLADDLFRGGHRHEFGVVGRIKRLVLEPLSGNTDSCDGPQPVDGKDLDIKIVGVVEVVRMQPGGQRGVVQRVADQAVQAVCFGEDLHEPAFGIVRRPIGVQGGVLGERAVRGLLAVDVPDAHDILELNLLVTVFELHVSRKGFASRVLHDAVDVFVGECGCGAQCVFAHLDVYAVAVSDARAQRFGEPVGAVSGFGPLQTAVVQLLVFDQVSRCLRVVVESFGFFDLQFFERVAKVVTAQVGHFQRQLALVRDACLVGQQRLGFDHDDAVCGFGAVDGFGGGVFEDRHAGDTVHIHIEDALYGGFETVQDEQRRIGVADVVAFQVHSCGASAGRERRGSPQLHIRECIGVRSGREVGHDVQRGVDAFQTLKNIHAADLLQRLSGNGGGGSGIAFGFTGEDTRHDDFVDGCGFFLHPDELGVTRMQRDRFVSDK